MSFFQAFRRKPTPKEMNLELATVIVSMYGAVLENGLEGIGCSAAETNLPFEKDLIKDALVRVAKVEFTNAKQMSLLRAGYMHLASFRSDGGQSRKLWRRGDDIETTIENHRRLERNGLLLEEIEREVGTITAISEEMDELAQEFDLRAIASWEPSRA